MEVISIEKKINHLIFYLPLMTNDKFLSLSLLTPLEKNPRVAIEREIWNKTKWETTIDLIQSTLETLIRSQQLQQNLCNLIRAKPQVGLGFVNFVVSLWLLCLIVGEEEFLEMGCVWMFEKKIVWLFLFVIFVFVVSIEIESEWLDFNLIENEFDGLKFGIPKSSLSHSRC